jgi:hypothetical protein
MQTFDPAGAILAQKSHVKREKDFPRANAPFPEYLFGLSLEWNGSAGQPQYAGIGIDTNCGVLRLYFQARVLALRNLPFHPFHQHNQLLRFMISLGLFAHLLEVLGSIRDTIRHKQKILGEV